MLLVDVYVNLNLTRQVGEPVYSVREHGGRVMSHEKYVLLRDVRMTVQPAIQKRIAAGGAKSVHAWVVGEKYELIGLLALSGWRRLRYNPREMSTFILSNGTPVWKASWARLDRRGAWVIL